MKLIPTGDGYYRVEREAGERAEAAVRVLQSEQTSLRQANAIAFVTLAEAGQIDDVTAGEHTALFAPWSYPITYAVGQLRAYEGKLYRCVSAHTSQADWTPDAAASLWALAADPTEAWPAWSQPLGAHDAYGLGDQVSHNGSRWVSAHDGNVWEPGVYGWDEVE